MKPSERTGLIALVTLSFFIFLAVASYFLPAWVSVVIGLVLMAAGFILFATYHLQHSEERNDAS